jgi:NAD(P)-dependent dehydrogenase (short-subunit alcohol dehydrogenase family)
MVAAMTVRQVAITGASRGIGKAISEHFLKSGWRVWALARTAESVKPLEALGDVHFVAFDAANERSVMDAALRLTTEAGHLSALVNNAGIALSAPIHKTSTEDFNRLMHINVTAPFLLIRELSGAMVKAGHGRIVNIASTAAKKGFKYTAAYCASKHALLGLTRSLALDFAPKNVTVNAVCPGWTETDMFAASVQRIAESTGRSQDEARETLAKMNPMHRPVKPEEVAEVVYFLCASPAGAAITGAEYTIDGGETV